MQRKNLIQKYPDAVLPLVLIAILKNDTTVVAFVRRQLCLKRLLKNDLALLCQLEQRMREILAVHDAQLRFQDLRI